MSLTGDQSRVHLTSSQKRAWLGFTYRKWMEGWTIGYFVCKIDNIVVNGRIMFPMSDFCAAAVGRIVAKFSPGVTLTWLTKWGSDPLLLTN